MPRPRSLIRLVGRALYGFALCGSVREAASERERESERRHRQMARERIISMTHAHLTGETCKKVTQDVGLGGVVALWEVIEAQGPSNEPWHSVDDRLHSPKTHKEDTHDSCL